MSFIAVSLTTLLVACGPEQSDRREGPVIDPSSGDIACSSLGSDAAPSVELEGLEAKTNDELRSLYLVSVSCLEDDVASHAILSELARRGDNWARRNLGVMMLFNVSITDDEEGERLLRQAIDDGDVEAAAILEEWRNEEYP